MFYYRYRVNINIVEIYLLFWFPLIFCLPLVLQANTIKVKKRAPQNQKAVFQFRVPRGYDSRKTCRVLVIFGGRNTDGKADASGRMGWGATPARAAPCFRTQTMPVDLQDAEDTSLQESDAPSPCDRH